MSISSWPRAAASAMCAATIEFLTGTTISANRRNRRSKTGLQAIAASRIETETTSPKSIARIPFQEPATACSTPRKSASNAASVHATRISVRLRMRSTQNVILLQFRADKAQVRRPSLQLGGIG